VRLGKSLPTTPTDLHGVQHGAGHREEDGGAAEGVRGLAERRDDRVQRDRTDDEEAHAHIRSGALIPTG